MQLPHVTVIGGGGTGAALLHDLSQRGFPATLMERGEITSGTTGRHHGQLHSGARYAVSDREIARECYRESLILRKIAPQSLEVNYGLFVTLDEEDEAYAPRFIEACGEAGIPVREISVDEALRMEPELSPSIRRAVLVPDGTINAFRLPLSFFTAAKLRGARIMNFCRVTGITVKNGRVHDIRYRDYRSGREKTLETEWIINAAGPWTGEIASLAGIDLPVTPSPGTMVAVKGRLCNMIVSHLHPPHDGDIIVPQRRLSIIGSTQWITTDPDKAETPHDDIARLVARAGTLIPSFAAAPFHAAWTAVRPLAGRSASKALREISRDFSCIDHESDDGIAGLISVAGGKATVLRAMAEHSVDLLCKKLGLSIPCGTADEVLPVYSRYYSE